MEKVKVPKRSERLSLIKNRGKNAYEKIMIRELERMVGNRLTEKLLVTLVTLMWLLVSAYGNTIYCKIWGIPLAIISLLIGVWVL